MDDFIDNLNINNISREMQSTLEDEGDFEPNDLGDDASTNLSNVVATGRGSDSLGVLEGTHNVGPKSEEFTDNDGAAKAASDINIFNSEENLQPFTSPKLTQYLTMSNTVSNDGGRNSVESEKHRISTLRSFPPRLVRLNKNNNSQTSRHETNASHYSNRSGEDLDTQYQPDFDVLTKCTQDSPDRFNLGLSAHLPKRVTDRGLATIAANRSASFNSRLSIDAMEENNTEILELSSDEIL